MNFRKDIYERVKYIMKEQSEMKVNCSKLGRQFNCDRRTVSRYVELAKNGEKPSQRVYQKKTDGFEHIIEEKVKTILTTLFSVQVQEAILRTSI